ncbi:MAG: hypothetical protein IH984_06140 [Planctomycetes bacterium]|nr:hypothetical protein [Planctomycetota bacterium]
MNKSDVFEWMKNSQRRQLLLKKIKQPMTVSQLANQTKLQREACTFLLWQLSVYCLVKCLNKEARACRLYWLTDSGKDCQRRLLREECLPAIEYNFPRVDWKLYGWVCYRHRSTVLKTMVMPMQPAEIKRRALAQNPLLRMNVNNVLDVLRDFLSNGLVRVLSFSKQKRRIYELTEVGKAFQELLNRAEVMA